MDDATIWLHCAYSFAFDLLSTPKILQYSMKTIDIKALLLLSKLLYGTTNNYWLLSK